MGFDVARILKGEKAAILPVQVPTKYRLGINLKTASSICQSRFSAAEPSTDLDHVLDGALAEAADFGGMLGQDRIVERAALGHGAPPQSEFDTAGNTAMMPMRALSAL